MQPFRTVAGTLSLALFGCTPWPQAGYDRLAERLERGPTRLECSPSAWAKSQEFDQPSPSILDGEAIPLDPKTALWKQSDNAVITYARATRAGYFWEFSISEFGPSHYYFRDGYHCSKAAIPVSIPAPPLGQMTDEGTAMDGKYREMENPLSLIHI